MRKFLGAILTITSLVAPMVGNTAQAQSSNSTMTDDSDFDPIVDNDAKAEAEEQTGYEKNMPAVAPFSERAVRSANANLMPFSVVSAHLSRYLEESFDIFMLVNTAEGGSTNVLVPSQHMLVLERTTGGDIFTRNGATDAITGVAQSAEQIGTFPVSTGQSGRGSILTFSGIFRIDPTDSRGGLATGIDASMSHALYIDHTYASGRDSGVAIHGTPRANYGLLGNSRASHGCIRTRHTVAKMLYTKLMPPAGAPFSSSDYWDNDLASFNLYHRLPNADEQNAGGPRRGGIKALVVTFNGY